MLNRHLKLARPLVTFDLETTGKDPMTARIVQFAMTVHRPDGDPKPYRTLVNPGISIPDESIDSHGITDEIIRIGCARCKSPEASHPHDGCDRFRPIPRWADIAPNLIAGLADCDFAGTNVMRYDLPLLAEEFHRVGISFNYSRAYVLDTHRLWQVLEPRSLSDAVEYFAGRKLEGAHDAMNDVHGTDDVLLGMLTGTRYVEVLEQRAREKHLPKTVKELHELCWSDNSNKIDSSGKFVFIDGEACFNFGKNAGKPIKNDIGYLKWMLGQSFPADVRRICEDAIAGNFPKPLLEEMTR